MRLDNKTLKIIQKILKGKKVILFGSRIYNDKKGGDIDLYIDSSNASLEKKIDFLVFLKQKIGDRKIDVVVNKEGLIKKNAKKGILLWKS